MPHIDLYAAHALDRSQTCADFAAQLTAQLDTVDHYDTTTRGRIETARRILGDQQRRAAYDALLTDPAAHIDEAVLGSIASGASSAATLPPVGFPPVQGSYPPAPVQQGFQAPQHAAYPPAQPQYQPAAQQRVVRVVVVPDGLMPTTEFWADEWAIEMSPDGSAIRLVGTGKGSAAKKAAKTSGGDWGWIAGGGIAGLFLS
ncbi:hypothetical protein SAMN04488550_0574 [Gordonia malaquae]|uniref:Uncharacterized protein n=1 Tax=Gordonia malaquae NBRC 108250 TaxID=1223542 RepID=M3UYE5_GORML|nr:hypothetical protein [Gordonia malaquae]GAC80862.1 hypothetical protein GM1_023_00210 [Gordonia malaquae NBRC 108250]SEB66193.1 hypothetical protein SAMN04488550_0574 [Gordonia malaquae]